jgi:hypothetical protein
MKKLLLSLALISSLFGDDVDDLMGGFDEDVKTESKKPDIKDKNDELMDGFDEDESLAKDNSKEADKDELMSGFDDEEPPLKQTTKKEPFLDGLEGKFTQSLAYSFQNDSPHDDLSSFKSLLFLEYNHDLPSGYKLKINANAFYDLSYTFKGRDKFTDDELSDLESEVELFDAFVEGSLSKNLDIKLGRQVVVWGKSDTIRVTDILNPLDNRRPAMVDIEDLRLPEAMIKLDYYYDKYRVSPIIILEQRFNKNPPFGGDFNPSSKKLSKRDEPSDATYALNIAGEFSGFDADFYLANYYPQDELGLPLLQRKKIDMVGVALNYVYESWLLKSEFAYKRDFQFLQTGDKKFDRFDSLLGFEYKGIADTTISYDIANKHIDKKSKAFKQDSYTNAFRATSDFLNSTLHANYLVSLFGKKLDKGGFQRAWMKYDIADGVSTNFGIVDYIGGDAMFDVISDNDMIFMDVSYSF